MVPARHAGEIQVVGDVAGDSRRGGPVRESARPIWVDALLDASLTAIEFRVWLYLYWRQGSHNGAWPRRETIATDLQLSLEGLRKIVKRLAARGCVEVARPEHTAPGAGLSYRVITPTAGGVNTPTLGGVNEGNTPTVVGVNTPPAEPPHIGRTHTLNTANSNSSSRAHSIRLAGLLRDLITQRQPKAREHKASLEVWADDIDRLIRIDDHGPEEIEAVIRWCQADSFWQGNIRSGKKLRQKYDQLESQMNRPRGRRNGDAYDRDYSRPDGMCDYRFDLTPAMS
jgi:hypothetical protein